MKLSLALPLLFAASTTQAAADEITFSAVYSNIGSADQTNTKLALKDFANNDDTLIFSWFKNGEQIIGSDTKEFNINKFIIIHFCIPNNRMIKVS